MKGFEAFKRSKNHFNKLASQAKTKGPKNWPQISVSKDVMTTLISKVGDVFT
jgi:hypothetical protein